MADDDPRARARATEKKDRLTGPVHKGLTPKGGHVAQTKKAPVDTRPLLLVGNLDGLTPSALSVSANKDGSGLSHTIDTARVDYRKAKGFNQSLETSLAQLGYPIVEGAEVRAVNGNAELLRAARGAGSRQIIYFGHAAGPGALWPGGTDGQPVDRAALEKAFGSGGPRPIFLGCNAAGTPLIGAPAPANAIGLDRLLSLDNLSATVRNLRSKAVTAKDIEVRAIDLSVGAKGYAPQAPLHSREAGTPP